MSSLKDLEDVVDVTVGETLYISSYKSFGVVRYFGSTDFASGIWVGLELPGPIGKNDGTVKGKRYFPCQSQYGIFVRVTACKRLKQENLDDSGDYSAGNTPPMRAVGRSSVAARDSTISSISSKAGGFKTPNKTVPLSAIEIQSPEVARLNRPFLSRATRESLLGASKDKISKKVATGRGDIPRDRTSSYASRTLSGSSQSSLKPSSPVANHRAPSSKTPTRSRTSNIGTTTQCATTAATLPRGNSNLDAVISELSNRVLILEDTMKKISDIILDSVQAIVSNRSVAPNAELREDEVDTLKSVMSKVAVLAYEAELALLHEREKHAR